MPTLSEIIPPEISNDQLSSILFEITAGNHYHNLLEIGGSGGSGSTSSILSGLNAAANKSANLFSIEISLERHQALTQQYFQNPQLHAIHGSSIDINQFPSLNKVFSTWVNKSTKLSNVPWNIVLDWYSQDLSYMKRNHHINSVVSIIKDIYSISIFDFVLIDGSEFTGMADLQNIYGASTIVLDDVSSFKCYEARKILNHDPNYNLIAENLSLRNGFSVFSRNPLNLINNG